MVLASTKFKIRGETGGFMTEKENMDASTEQIRIGQAQDVNNKDVFKNHVLCAQFLRYYADLEILANVQPEDIEDVPIYLVSLIEHKSDVDYNVSMQLLRYMVCIWDDYAKTADMEKLGSPKNKGFRYPPIFPVVINSNQDMQMTSCG